jgi:hypothetical protein
MLAYLLLCRGIGTALAVRRARRALTLAAAHSAHDPHPEAA